jgi:hypothetical protein
MATGNLEIRITDMAGQPIGARVDFDLHPQSGGGVGAGGAAMSVSANMGSATDLTITGIICRGGPGTMYRVLANAPHYRSYGFFQLIEEDATATAADDVEFWVKPGDVTGIRGPQFADLADRVRGMLADALMVEDQPHDRDLVGLSGSTLYGNLGPLRQAALLNIVKKASHVTSESCLAQFGALLVCRQDRIFAMVDASLPARLAASPRFRSADGSLHDPLAGFAMTGESFKSRDAHANLQVTFLRRLDNGALAADIDIDESSGIDHGREVIKNALFRNKTNPYLIREFLLSADPMEHTLDPAYRFVF